MVRVQPEYQWSASSSIWPVAGPSSFCSVESIANLKANLNLQLTELRRRSDSDGGWSLGSSRYADALGPTSPPPLLGSDLPVHPELESVPKPPFDRFDPLVGCSAPDFEFEDGTRVGEFMHDGQAA